MSNNHVHVEHVYPSELASVVLRRWEEAHAAGLTQLAPLDAASIAPVLSTCYQATLLREEGRPITFRLAVGSPEAFDASAGPPSGLHRLLFTRRLPLDPHELRRLAPAASFSRSLIGATLTPAGEPHVWGLVHSGPHWLQSVRGGRSREQTLPDLLTIAATGPGRLLVSIGAITLAELGNGTLSPVGMDLFQSRWVQARLGEMGRLHAARDDRSGSGAGERGAEIAAQFAAVLAGHVLRRMVATVRGDQHGGTLIMVPRRLAADLLENGRHLRIKYGFTDEEPRRRIETLVDTILKELARVEPRDGITDPWDLYESGEVGPLGEIDDALFEVAHLLADFTRVDGTVLITDTLEVLGFGVEIAGELPEVSQVARALDLEGAQREWVRTDRVGTRHRSAYRLCHALHDALALVVSQDGGLRFIRWHVDGVTYWEQFAKGPWEI